MAKRRRRRQKSSIPGGVGCFILIGILALIGSITQLVEEAPSVAYGFVIIAGFAVMLIIGIPKYRHRRHQQLLQHQQELDFQKQQEKSMFRIAVQHGGRLTAVEAAAELSFSIAEAETMLMDIVRRGYATMQTTEKGVVLYTFPISNFSSEQSDPQMSPSEEPKKKTLQCLISGKIVPATPEEHVRQQVAARLITKYGYQQGDMEVEFPIMMGRARKRADIVIFPHNATHTQEHIWCIIETKARSVNDTELKEAVGQLKSYIAASMNCQYAVLAWKKIRVYNITAQNGKRTFVQENDFPINTML